MKSGRRDNVYRQVAVIHKYLLYLFQGAFILQEDTLSFFN